MEPGHPLARPEQPVVCIRADRPFELFATCLRSVLKNTPAEVPILVADDATPDSRVSDFLGELDASGVMEHDVFHLRSEPLAVPAALNRVLEITAPADMVLVRGSSVVGDGWLPALAAAAGSDSIVATASALTNREGILQVPAAAERGAPAPEIWLEGGAAGAVRERALPRYPRIPGASEPCVYIRRAAAQLAGGFDDALEDPASALTDFSQRCVLRGLSHVAADDVLVLDQEPFPAASAGDAVIEARYPYLARALLEIGLAKRGPLAGSLARARRAVRGLTLTIDGRVLAGGFSGGIQVHTLELIHALWRSGGAQIRVLLGIETSDRIRSALEAMDGVELLPYESIGPGTPSTDVFHRPYQVSSMDDLRVAEQLGERLVITHQDLIAYRNPGYFSSYDEWVAYERLTRSALAMADRVLFFSQHAADDALSDDLIERDRTRVIHIGVDHQALEPEPSAQPAGLPSLDPGYVLCLGADYRHKNRLFMLEVLERMQRDNGWDGRLVFAGPHVPVGSSAGDEAAFLGPRPSVARAVTNLPAVSEEGKRWLVEHAALVAFPSVYEGFGLVPFEAAQAGVPCLFAPQSSLAEILPDDAALVVPWDADQAAARALELIRDPEAREALVTKLKDAASRFTWEAAARQALEAYDEAMDAPARGSVKFAHEVVELSAKLDELTEAAGEDGLALVGPAAYLPRDVRRPLLAVATRKRLAKPFFGLIKLLYRLTGPGSGSGG